MRKILLFVLIVWSGIAYGQVPPGYTKVNAKQVYTALRADSGFHVPGYSTVPNIRSGVWPGAGNIGVDTVLNRLYFYSNGSWRYSTAGTGGGTPTLQSVSDAGNTSTTGILIGASSGLIGQLQITKNNIQTQSDANGIYLANTSNSTGLTVMQLAPPIVWQFSGYKATPTTGSRQFRFRQDCYPVNLSSGTMRWSFALDSTGQTYKPKMTLKSSGELIIYSDSATNSFGTINGAYIGGNCGFYIGSQPVNYATCAPTGGGNTAIGISALNAITTGDLSTALGNGALSHATTGGINTAVGYNSMPTLTTGYSNAAFGNNSMLSETIGFQNTSIGAGSMENATTAQENAALGYDAGLNATTAFRNVWLGWNAKSGADGYENVIAGYASGTNLTTGNHGNIFIGHGAGNNASQKTDAVNSIGIGENAYSTKSNQAIFGSSAITETILRGALIDSTLGTGVGTKDVRYNPTNGLFTYSDTTTGGGGSSPAGNFGNLQINRNGAFAAPGSDSLDFESATGLSVKGNINTINDVNIGGATDNYNLNLYGSTYAYQSFQTAGSGTGSTNGFQIGFENTGVYFLNRQNSPILFYTNNTSRMTIGAAGEVTIPNLTAGGIVTAAAGSGQLGIGSAITTIKSGSFSGVGTATTTFTVTFGGTLASAVYAVNVTPTAALSAALFYVTNKTTTTFDVMYLSGLTGTCTFDWALHQ